tara:strand:- start:1071 stop:1847 length:777 start_codon:yes stop_codon:yes gene_type:complete
MKQILTLLIFILKLNFFFAQSENSFRAGEWLKFKLSYSGWVKAGYSTLHVKDAYYNNDSVYHVIARGKTTGPIKWFFKVNDRFESYFDKETTRPYKFIRKTYEGGHTKNRIIQFDYVNNLALVNDLKTKKNTKVQIKPDIQDMISAYYFIRSNYDLYEIKKGEIIDLDMFFDSEIFKFKLKFLGYSKLKTKFGNISCLKFRPYVIAGRVFKEDESVTLWVSADKNKIPIKIKADLRVGSINADLESFKGLKYPFKIQL